MQQSCDKIAVNINFTKSDDKHFRNKLSSYTLVVWRNDIHALPGILYSQIHENRTVNCVVLLCLTYLAMVYFASFSLFCLFFFIVAAFDGE